MAMYIAHSKLDTEAQGPKKATPRQSEFAKQMAFKFYKKACLENADRIKKIQQYFPGWEPKFNYK